MEQHIRHQSRGFWSFLSAQWRRWKKDKRFRSMWNCYIHKEHDHGSDSFLCCCAGKCSNDFPSSLRLHSCCFLSTLAQPWPQTKASLRSLTFVIVPELVSIPDTPAVSIVSQYSERRPRSNQLLPTAGQQQSDAEPQTDPRRVKANFRHLVWIFLKTAQTEIIELMPFFILCYYYLIILCSSLSLMYLSRLFTYNIYYSLCGGIMQLSLKCLWGCSDLVSTFILSKPIMSGQLKEQVWTPPETHWGCVWDLITLKTFGGGLGCMGTNSFILFFTDFQRISPFSINEYKTTKFKYSKQQPIHKHFSPTEIKSPDSLQKLLNLMSCWVRRNLRNIMKHCLQHFFFFKYLGILLNTANFAHEYISF